MAPTHRRQGFTLIELLVGVAVLAILLAIAVPSMQELSARQRLKAVNAELVTNLQYARSQSTQLNNNALAIQFQNNAAMSCYVILLGTLTGACDCTLTPGTACSGGNTEIRTVQVLASTDVQVVSQTQPNFFSFTSDGMRNVSANYVLLTSRRSGGTGQLQVTVNATGRTSVCSPDLSVTGVPGC